MEKVWIKSYPPGAPAEINPDAYNSLVELFEQCVKRFADRPAFMSMGVTLTFKQVDELSRDFAAYLQSKLGCEKGQHIALMMPNILQYPVAMLGAFRAGLTVVNVNPMYTPRELEHQLRDSGSESIVILANFAKTLQEVVKNTPIRNIIITEIGDLMPFLKGTLVNFVIKRVKKMVPSYHLPHTISFKDVIEGGHRSSLNPVKLAADDIAFLQYTGGTTGVSKGAILTHRNMIANVEQAASFLGVLINPGHDIIITALPLYHIFCLTANCMTVGFKFGSCNLLIINPRDLNTFIKDIKKVPFTLITGVNTLFNGLLHHPEFPKLNFKHLRGSIGGGMAVQKAVAEEWQKVTGVPLLEGYGLTETSPIVCINPTDAKSYTGATGLPVPSTEIAIIDEEGNHRGLNEAGELCVKGPQVMRGYWNRPDETAKIFTEDGWLRTGDIAKVDDQGFIRIVDRQKDMILVSGFNVYPNEVEDIVVHHPGVLEVAAIGVPDDKSGEAVKIVVVKKDPNLTKEELLKYCRENLTGYKIPKHIEFRKELPKTNVGKILRRALRESSPSQ